MPKRKKKLSPTAKKLSDVIEQTRQEYVLGWPMEDRFDCLEGFQMGCLSFLDTLKAFAVARGYTGSKEIPKKVVNDAAEKTTEANSIFASGLGYAYTMAFEEGVRSLRSLIMKQDNNNKRRKAACQRKRTKKSSK